MNISSKYCKLIDDLESSDINIRFAAVVAAGSVADPINKACLLELISKDENASVRIGAIKIAWEWAGTLANEEAKEFELLCLRSFPGDCCIRAVLVLHYGKREAQCRFSAPLRERHLLRLVADHPDSSLAGPIVCAPNAPRSPGLCSRLVNLWRVLSKSNRQNVNVLENASRFFEQFAPQFAEDALRDLISADSSNPARRIALARWLVQHCDSGNPQANNEQVNRAFDELNTMDLEAVDISDAVSALNVQLKGFIILERWEAVRTTCMEILKITTGPKRTLFADLRHRVFTWLGRIELMHNNKAGAQRCLVESAKVGSHPVLISFGPRMELADGILHAGGRVSVIEYLRCWSDVIPSMRPKFETYIEMIRDNEDPFCGGAN